MLTMHGSDRSKIFVEDMVSYKSELLIRSLFIVKLSDTERKWILDEYLMSCAPKEESRSLQATVKKGK